MEQNWVRRSAQISTIAQILFAIASFVGFLAPKQNDFLAILLMLDIVIQIIELAFYAIFVYYKQLPTVYRYIDWYITTPIQLISNIALLSFFNDNTITLADFTKDSESEIIAIFVLNFVMLSFGLMAEIYPSYKYVLVTLGILPFITQFTIMYYKYAINTNLGLIINTYVCILWFLYAIAAYLDYDRKNIMYNVLDVFAKNFYGLFVSIYIFYI